MRFFLFENPGKFIFEQTQAPSETPEGEAETPPEGKRSASETKNVFLEAQGEIAYSHNKDPNTNVENLLMVSLKENFRQWMLAPTFAEMSKNSSEIGKILPSAGEEPDDEDHVHQLKLDTGQILFINKDNEELFRLDISMVFRDKEILEIQYGASRELIERINRRARLRRMRRDSAYLHLLAAAAMGLPPYRPSPEPLPPPPDENEVRANAHVLDSLLAREQYRTQSLVDFESSVTWRAETLDDAEGLFKNGYNLRSQLDYTLADFNDDDWSAEENGKWKDVDGRLQIEALFKEDPREYEQMSYEQFLKANQSKLSTLHEEVTKNLTKDFKKDYEFFKDKKDRIKNAEKDSRLEEDLGYIWDMRADFLDVFQKLESYKKSQETVVYHVNPFKEHGWTVDNLRRAVQEGKNRYLDFDDVADELYGKNFDAIKKRLSELKIPDDVMEELKGDLRGDYGRMKKLLEDAKDDPKQKEKIKLVFDILGDYVVYSARLITLAGKLRYTESHPSEEREIFKLSHSDDPSVIKAKKALLRIFIDDIDAPTRNFTFGDKLAGLFTGEDVEGRIITMHDLNGQTYSVDRERFQRGISGQAAFKLAYEYALEYDSNGKETINIEELREKLKKFLQIGIPQYRVTGRNLHEIMKNDDLERTDRHDDNLRKLYESFSRRVDNFCDRLTGIQNGSTIGEDQIEEFLNSNKLPKDLLEFVRIGAAVDYDTTGKKTERQLKRESFARCKYKFKAEDAAKIIADLEKTAKFSQAELQRIREGLMLGVVMVWQEQGVRMAGLGLSIPLPHGYYLDAGVGVNTLDDWTWGVGVGIGAKVQVSKRLQVQLREGIGVSFSGQVDAGAAIIARYDLGDVELEKLEAGQEAGFFDTLSLMGTAGAGISGFGVGVGLERRPEVLLSETIGRKLLEAHINGPDGLSKYTEDQRYHKVEQHPDFYPEFYETLQAINSLGVADEDKPYVFNEFYKIYEEELRVNATQESFPIIRGIGIGAGFSWNNPLSALNMVIPFKFGVAERTFIIRVADSEGAKNLSAKATTAQLIEQYQGAKETPRQIHLEGKVVVDREGRLALAQVKGAQIDLRITDRIRELQEDFKNTLDIDVEPSRFASSPISAFGEAIEGSLEPSLFKLNIRKALGDVIISVDPDLRDNVSVVYDDNRLFLSVDRRQKIYVTREDVSYPFPQEGATETTYISIRANPYNEREGLGSVEERSPGVLWKRRGQRWIERRNIAYRGKPDERRPEQIISISDYQTWRQTNSDRANERLNQNTLDRINTAAERISQATSITGLETQKLPNNFQQAVDKLKGNANFMNSFKYLSTEGYDFKTVKAKWKEDLPKLAEFVKKWLIEYGESTKTIPAAGINDFVVETAITELVIASFIISKNKDAREAYKRYLESFEIPLLTSIFLKYIEEKHPDWAEAKRKAYVDNIVRYVKAQFEAVDPSGKAVPIEPDVFFGSVVGSRGRDDLDPYTGIRRLYNRVAGNLPHDLIVPQNLTYNPGSENEAESEVARFWVEFLSVLPDMNKDGAFTSLLEQDATTKRQEKLQNALHNPIALKLSRYAAAFLNAAEIEQLADAYEGKLVTEGSNSAGVEKFLSFCQKARDAELAGKKEMPMENTDFILVINTNVRMGVYQKCTNLTGILKEDFYLKTTSGEGVFVAAADGIHVRTRTKVAREDYGIFFAPGLIIETRWGEGEETVPAAPARAPAAGRSQRVLPP